MSARRARRARRNHVLLRVAAVVVLLLVLAHHVVLLLLIAVAIGVVCCLSLAGKRRRPSAKARVTKAQRAMREVNRRPAPVKQPGRPGDARARRNGWAPPAVPKLVTVALTAECASGDCVSCPGVGCGCPLCLHDSKRIVTINRALYDAEHAERVPF